MKRLTSPLRATWDWDRPPVVRGEQGSRRPDPETLRAVGAEIVRSRVLLLEIGYPDVESLEAGRLAAFLPGFAGSVDLVLDSETTVGLAGSRPWEGLGPETVWVDATPTSGGGDPPSPAKWPSRRYYLTAANATAVADLVLRDVAGGATALSFPVLPLFGALLEKARSLCPGPEPLRAFAAQIGPALRGRSGIDLRIHHYGLTELLRAGGVDTGDGEAPGHAGCQAGAALAYIDAAGVIYPCAALPVPLGRATREGGIARAWAGETLSVVREGVASLPAACADCDVLASCAGGCRGWAHFLEGDWRALGPDCTRY